MNTDEPKQSKKGIDVNATITPITHKKIETIDPTNWETTAVGNLYDQLTILQNRYFSALELNKPNLANQLQGFISQLQAIIKFREQQKQGSYVAKSRTD